eukprot:100930-Chlamydomonas_euryale.AAC.2
MTLEPEEGHSESPRHRRRDSGSTRGSCPAARTLGLCRRSCILQLTLRGCRVNAWMRKIWPSPHVSGRCGMLDLIYLFPIASTAHAEILG